MAIYIHQNVRPKNTFLYLPMCVAVGECVTLVFVAVVVAVPLLVGVPGDTAAVLTARLGAATTGLGSSRSKLSELRLGTGRC